MFNHHPHVFLSDQNTSSYLSIQDSAFPLDNDQSLSTCSAILQSVAPWELLKRQSRVGWEELCSSLCELAGEMVLLANNNKMRGRRGLFDIFPLKDEDVHL